MPQGNQFFMFIELNPCNNITIKSLYKLPIKPDRLKGV